MTFDYAGVLRDNLRRAMARHGISTARQLVPLAIYRTGPKAGKNVSKRSIDYLLGGQPFSPSLDLLIAVAAALDLRRGI